MYQKILLTNDGSDVAALAIPHAITLAKATGASVAVLQVDDRVDHLMTQMTPVTAEPMSSGEVTAEIAEEAVTAQKEAAQAKLSKVRAQLEAGGVTSVTAFVAEGDPGDAIVATAKEQGCDLIVMASHGRGGLGRALLGSVADHVARTATQALLLVRAQ